MPKEKNNQEKSQLRRHFSAGGTVFRKLNGQTSWLIIKSSQSNRWQLPKGKIDPGEKPNQAALREVWEETGVRGEILEKIETVRYFFMQDGKKILKSVVFYLMSSRGEEPRVDQEWAHEITKACWFPFEEAREKLAYKDERNILSRARELLKEME